MARSPRRLRRDLHRCCESRRRRRLHRRTESRSANRRHRAPHLAARRLRLRQTIERHRAVGKRIAFDRRRRRSARALRRTAAPRALARAARRRTTMIATATGARDAIRAMKAYTLELREAATKLNQNESPFDFPEPLKREVLARVSRIPWNVYPEFEATRLRSALANAYGLAPESLLVGNGSNELLASAIATFVEPGRRVAFARPTFALYEKLITIAGGEPVPIDIDPRSGVLPLDRADADVVIVCSPNNPTGGVLPHGGIQRLLDSGAVVLFDRAYGDFHDDELPPPDDRLVVFSTFSKA